jgi:hypothetical protein
MVGERGRHVQVGIVEPIPATQPSDDERAPRIHGAHEGKHHDRADRQHL